MGRSAVQDFISSLKDVTSSDVLLVILGDLPQTDIQRDTIIFQRTIFKLSEKYPLLARFKFNVSGIHPYSEELERAFYRLEWAQALGAVNPSYSSYRLDQNQIRASMEKFSGEQVSEIYKIRREFKECVEELCPS